MPCDDEDRTMVGVDVEVKSDFRVGSVRRSALAGRDGSSHTTTASFERASSNVSRFQINIELAIELESLCG